MSLESVFKLSLIMTMVDKLTGPMGGVSSSVGAATSKLEGMERSFGSMAKAGAVMAGVGTQITAAAMAPVQATFETRRALGELSSLGVKNLQTIEQAARDFSDTWSGTTKPEFISAAYDIKSGIASLSDEGVAQMTQLAALTAKATKSTAGEMTSLFATGYGIYKDYYSSLSDLAFGEMFSAGIAKSVQQFKTTGSGMAQSIQTLGAAATTANVPFEEQLSILGMLQATMGGAEAGTKYKAFLRSAVKGGEALGLSFTDANNQMLTMPQILDLLRGKFGETMDAAEKVQLQKAFGDTEAVALIDLMYSKVGDLEGNITGMQSALSSGASKANEMASAIQNTEPERYDRLAQRISNVKETIGTSMLPVINEMMDKTENLVEKLGGWIERNQGLVRVIMLLVLALGGLLTIGGTVISVIGAVGLIFTKGASYARGFLRAIKAIPSLLKTLQIRAMLAGDAIKSGFGSIKRVGSVAVGAIKNVTTSMANMARAAAVSVVSALRNVAVGLVTMARQAITTALTAMPGLIASVWSFTAALWANPITWIIMAVIALVAAIILLFMNWDKVTAFLQSAWNAACQGVSAGIDWLKAGFQGMINWISGIISWFGQAGRKIIDTLVGGIMAVAKKPVEAIKGIFQKVRNLLPFSDAKDGPLSTLTLSGKRTMTTFAEGVALADDSPRRAVAQGLRGVDAELRREAPRKVLFSSQAEVERDGDGEKSAGGKGGVTVHNLHLNVDIRKLKELKQLFKLLEELEEMAEGNGSEPEPQMA